MRLKSLSLGLVGLLSMGLVASGMPLDEAKPHVPEFKDIASSPPDAPVALPAIDRREIAIRNDDGSTLESPLVRQNLCLKFSGTDKFDSLSWMFSLKFKKGPNPARLWRRGVFSSPVLEEPDVTIAAITTISNRESTWYGGAATRLSGKIGGKDLEVDLVMHVRASADTCEIIGFEERATANHAGERINVDVVEYDTLCNGGSSSH